MSAQLYERKKQNSETRLTAASAPKQDPNTQTVKTNASSNGTVQNVRKLPGVSGRMLARQPCQTLLRIHQTVTG